MGIQFSWPVFDGLRAKSALELARAQTRIADLELRREQEQVAVEVARARAELRRARAVFDARRENASEAQEAFRLASLRFSRGLSTQLEVSDAQVALLTAEGGEARATYDLYLATAELARALGRPIPMPVTSRATRRSTPSAPIDSAWRANAIALRVPDDPTPIVEMDWGKGTLTANETTNSFERSEVGLLLDGFEHDGFKINLLDAPGYRDLTE